RWITRNLAFDYDAAAVKGPTPVETPEKVLALRAGQSGGQSVFFQAVGKACGLDVVSVSGHSRRAVAGPMFARNAVTTASGLTYAPHVWNAVRINGRWYVVDVTQQNGQAKRNGQVAPDFEPKWDWFLVTPEQAAYYHLAADAKQQHLSKT